MENSKNINSLFRSKAKIVKIEVVFPLQKKIKKESRKKLGTIINLGLKLLTNAPVLIRYPVYSGSLPIKKKTMLKRRENTRIAFYKAVLKGEEITNFFIYWIRNLVYKKKENKNSDFLFNSKEASFYETNKPYYRPKSLNNNKKLKLRAYSFKFATKIIDFLHLSKLESITYPLLDIQINIIINGFTKIEAVTLLKQNCLIV